MALAELQEELEPDPEKVAAEGGSPRHGRVAETTSSVRPRELVDLASDLRRLLRV